MIESGIVHDIPHEHFENQDDLCLKTFSSLSKFYSHLRIHTQEKPYACHYPDCKMRFNQKGNLNQHINLVHSKYDASASMFKSYKINGS